MHPLLEIMSKNFAKTWVPPRDFAVDESTWSFKWRICLNIFVKGKPKKHVFLVNCPHAKGRCLLWVLFRRQLGKEKRQKRQLSNYSLDECNMLKLLLQRRHSRLEVSPNFCWEPCSPVPQKVNILSNLVPLPVPVPISVPHNTFEELGNCSCSPKTFWGD